MTETYFQVLSLFDRKERRAFYFLMVLMVLAAIAEIVGISSVLVFLSVLAEPAQITENAVFSALYEGFDFASIYSFQIALSIGVFVVVFLSLAVKALAAYAMMRFSNVRGYDMSCRLLRAYLHQPYTWFLRENSADIAKNVLDEMDQLIFRVIVPLLRLISGTISTLAIVGFLLVVDPFISILAATLLGGSYTLLYRQLRKYIQRVGADMIVSNSERYRIVGEATGGFKQVKIMGLEDNYTVLFDKPAKDRAKQATMTQILGELPRFALEGLTFGILLTLVLVLLLRNDGDLVATIPTLGIFAFSVMRLLPAIQQMYFSLMSIRSAAELLKMLSADYNTMRHFEIPKIAADDAPLPLNKELSMTDIGFSYVGAARPALDGIALNIPAYTTVGIVGGTGAGKTTLVDLLLGLLDIQTGTMAIDGVPVTAENKRKWQKTIGYVPQEIFLTDDTIRRNIAFGVPDADVDMEALENAARIAALDDFVTQELPDGYETFVGERGIRLSGGQRQRIGIARALYTNPSLLVMDEATSALDNITERVVMEAVQNIRSEKTIILIAHRLSTVRDCDQILMMERGKVAATGTYDELLAKNETFRLMAQKD